MELAERMRKTVLGQVTWADPDIGKKCWECKNYKRGICTLVRVVSGKTGVKYDGKRAIACSKFAGVDVEDTKA